MDSREVGRILDRASLLVEPVAQMESQVGFSVDEAYEIQAYNLAHRIKRGENFIGLKMGFTSKAKMEQMGVHDMIWGRLTDKMHVANGSKIFLDKFIHPRAEPELCFRVSQDIEGELDLNNVKNYIDGVAAAVEIIDSRYKDFKFSLADVIADNCSSAAFIVGEWHHVELDISHLKMDFYVDVDQVGNGTSNAILGNPWESVCACTRLAHKYGIKIKKGDMIMAGAASAAVHLKKGQYIELNVENLGRACFRTV